MPGPSGFGPGPQQTLTITEQDGSPLVTGVTKIKFPNGAVTNDGGGVVSVAGDGTGTVTNVTGTAPIAVATGTTTPVVSLNDTAVTPASYTNANITVDQKGRITAAANGSGGSPAGSNGDLQMKSGSSFAASHLNDNGTNVSSSEAILAPDGLAATPAYSFTNGTNTGLVFNTQNAGNLLVVVGAFPAMSFSGANGPVIASNVPLMWASGTGIAGAYSVDTSVNRGTAGVVCAGTTNNANDSTGTFKATNLITTALISTAGLATDSNGKIIAGSTGVGAALSCLVSNTALSQATGTVYSSPGYGGTPLAAATEAAVGWAVPRAGTVSALQVYSGTVAKVNTPSTVITVRKNGVDTALTLTMTQTVSTLTADNTHSFTVALGDIITVSFTTTGAAAVSTSIAGVSFLLN